MIVNGGEKCRSRMKTAGTSKERMVVPPTTMTGIIKEDITTDNSHKRDKQAIRGCAALHKKKPTPSRRREQADRDTERGRKVGGEVSAGRRVDQKK